MSKHFLGVLLREGTGNTDHFEFARVALSQQHLFSADYGVSLEVITSFTQPEFMGYLNHWLQGYNLHKILPTRR